MDGVCAGTATEIGQRHHGWFVGHFIEEKPCCKTSDVEVKWGVHKKGESNEQFAANQVATTMSVLVRGRFRLFFRDGDKTEETILSQEGEFALWMPGIVHNWVADEDTVILTVRWPSVPKDQIQKKE